MARKVASSPILDKLLEAQNQSIREFIEGKDVQFFPTLKLLIFGDFKKHTFKYQFLSTANPVENYEVISQSSAAAHFSPECVGKINKYVQKWVNEQKKPLPELVVLKDFEVSSIKEFIQNPQGNYLFCVTDLTTFEKHTGYHTSTILSVFAHLREQKLVADEHLKKVNLLLMK